MEADLALMWATTSATRSWGDIWYYRTAFWTTTVLGGVGAIKRDGDMCFLYGDETTNFSEAIVRSSEGFRYRRGSSDGKAQIGRLKNRWSWRRRMEYGTHINF